MTTKAIQPTTGTVHYAVRTKHLYSGLPMLRPACRSGRLGANHYLCEVPEDHEVTCKRCAATQPKTGENS